MLETTVQVRARLQEGSLSLMVRVEAVTDQGEVVVSLWHSTSDPVVEQVLALERIC